MALSDISTCTSCMHDLDQPPSSLIGHSETMPSPFSTPDTVPALSPIGGWHWWEMQRYLVKLSTSDTSKPNVPSSNRRPSPWNNDDSSSMKSSPPPPSYSPRPKQHLEWAMPSSKPPALTTASAPPPPALPTHSQATSAQIGYPHQGHYIYRQLGQWAYPNSCLACQLIMSPLSSPLRPTPSLLSVSDPPL
jgi:hypothetical protein